ncbi:hypothetical protein TRIUR3_27822 [Triticum urartu]|uniref:Uncharacterized protein n=1 Tax=Triticum urartu TaxID=4572 RepID=M7YYM2_TRIUA|nr:hypothetical protein TRIUR3_27822 [Triticum urartu]
MAEGAHQPSELNASASSSSSGKSGHSASSTASFAGEDERMRVILARHAAPSGTGGTGPPPALSLHVPNTRMSGGAGSAHFIPKKKKKKKIMGSWPGRFLGQKNKEKARSLTGGGRGSGARGGVRDTPESSSAARGDLGGHLLEEHLGLAFEAGDPEDSPGFLQAIRESEKASTSPLLLEKYQKLAPEAGHPDDPPDSPGLHAALAASRDPGGVTDLSDYDLGSDDEDKRIRTS